MVSFIEPYLGDRKRNIIDLDMEKKYCFYFVGILLYIL